MDIQPCPQKGVQQPPTFRPLYCGQTAGGIAMPLDIEVDLGPGNIVLDGDPAPGRGTTPSFRPMSIVAKRSSVWATARHLSLLDLEKSCTCDGVNLTHFTLLLLLHYLVKVETRKMHGNTNSAFNVNYEIALKFKCIILHWQFQKMFWRRPTT